jgi:hypothetical protein
MNASFQILSILSYAYHPFIRRCISVTEKASLNKIQTQIQIQIDGNVNITRKNAAVLLDASKEGGPEENSEENCTLC